MPSNDPLLFDPDDLPQKPPDGSLTIRRPAARPLSKEERAFNRAVARVQSLRVRLDEEKRRLDRALVFHATELRPRAEQAAAMRTDLVRRLALFLDDRVPADRHRTSGLGRGAHGRSRVVASVPRDACG